MVLASSSSAHFFQVHQERDQVHKFILAQAFLKPLRHRAERMPLLLINFLPGDHVLLCLVVHQRDRRACVGDLDAIHDLSVLEYDGRGLETWRDGSAWIQDRFDNVDFREATSQPCEFRANPFPLIADAMAFDAERFLGVQKDLPAMFRIAVVRQSSQGESLMKGGCAFAAETELELCRRLRTHEANDDLVEPFYQRHVKLIRIGADDSGFYALKNLLAIQPDCFQARTGGEEFDQDRFGNYGLAESQPCAVSSSRAESDPGGLRHPLIKRGASRCRELRWRVPGQKLFASRGQQLRPVSAARWCARPAGCRLCREFPPERAFEFLSSVAEVSRRTTNSSRPCPRRSAFPRKRSLARVGYDLHLVWSAHFGKVFQCRERRYTVAQCALRSAKRGLAQPASASRQERRTSAFGSCELENPVGSLGQSQFTGRERRAANAVICVVQEPADRLLRLLHLQLGER